MAVVLAAGAATRFGRAKPVAQLGGRPLIAHVLDAASAAGIRRLIVVVGHDARAVSDAVADREDVEVVVNPDHQTGQASSVRAGIAAAREDPAARVAVLLLADQPGIAPTVIRRVVSALEDGSDAARAYYEDAPGHPVAFHRRVWPRLVEELHGDVGARQLMADLHVAHVTVAGPMPPDVDVPADLDRLTPDVDDP